MTKPDRHIRDGRFWEAVFGWFEVVERPLRAENDYDHLTIDQFTSTPHQPANARFAPSLLPKVGETGPVQTWKSRKIKALQRKPLKRLT